MTGKFKPTKATVLEHYFGNNVGMVRLWQEEQDLVDTAQFEANKRKFIEGLEIAIQSDLSEDGVTNAYLAEMVELARDDWTNPQVIQVLYRKYAEVKRI
ncbi:hypothetical protein HY500_01450 [Candidatus Woesearchaeota archaeon]|nr:hypothetical protein [Candidatus Woesearchaeota archaeon]